MRRHLRSPSASEKPASPRLVWPPVSRWFVDDINEASLSMVLEESRLPRLLQFTIVILSLAVFGFIGWAAVTPVKEIARTEGQVLPSGYNQLVQHLEGGMVREIIVHEGDLVKKDDVLVRLDGAGTQEDKEGQRFMVEALSLQAERLQAMLHNRMPDFSAINASDEAKAEQLRMYETMQAAKSGERAVLEQQIAQKRTMVKRLEQALGTARSNMVIAQESEKIYSDLNSQRLVARTQYLKKQEEYNTRRGEVGALMQQLSEGRNELSEYERRAETLAAQQRDGAYTELHKVESELAQARESLKKRTDRVTRLDVRAPVAGYVKGLRLNTIGEVIPAGQTLMEIVPVEEKLIVEARILPEQIGRVEVGQVVRVKVDSYDYVRFGAIEGTLEALSAMTFTDEARREDYYKGRVRLTHNYAGGTPGLYPILPGMTVDADIVTGEKSILGYLLKPIQVAMHNALTEE